VCFFWYPLDFTFVCPTEIIAYGDRSPEFEKLNCQVIAASCDSAHTHLAWCNTPRSDGGLGEMKIPLLADFSKKIATDYGVLCPGAGDEGVPLRALFIIAPNGVIRHITFNDLPVGRNVDETLRLLQAYQYTDIHGEVCPAGWQPGAPTMVDDHEKSKEYFKTVANTGSAGKGSKVSDVDDDVTFQKTIRSAGYTVVDYWAPWCKNCKAVMPTVEDLAAKMPQVEFIKVNTEAENGQEIGMAAGVDSLPCFQIYKGGAKVGEFKGSKKDSIVEAITMACA
jgi:peroxiredoxin 1